MNADTPMVEQLLAALPFLIGLIAATILCEFLDRAWNGWNKKRGTQSS